MAILNDTSADGRDRVCPKGTLDKFVGDMVMALFGAPLMTRITPARGDAALEMIRELNRLNENGRRGAACARIDRHHTGPMIAGNIGPSDYELYRYRRLREPGEARIFDKETAPHYHQRGDTRGCAGPVPVSALGYVCGKARPGQSYLRVRRIGMKIFITIVAIVSVSAPAFAQLGGIGAACSSSERKQQFDDLIHRSR